MENRKDLPPQEDNARFQPTNIPRRDSTRMSILNPPRFYDLLLSKAALDDLLRKSGEELSFISYSPSLLRAALSADVETLEILDITAFRIAISGADNIEICQLANGKVRLSLMFNHALLPIM